MKPSIKSKLIAFVEKYNQVCEREMKCEFDEELCYISGEPIFSSVFFRIFKESMGSRYSSYYISVRDSLPCLIVY